MPADAVNAVDSGDESGIAVEERLYDTLGLFFDPERFRSKTSRIDKVASRMVGRYIMYRPDFRPATGPMRPNGLIRASTFEVSSVRDRYYCREIQAFTRDRLGAEHFSKASGPLFPADDRLFFLMRGEDHWSIKLGAIERFRDWEGGPMSWFFGRLWNVSNIGKFPVAAFFCLRDTDNFPVGIVEIDNVPDAEARTYLMRFVENFGR